MCLLLKFIDGFKKKFNKKCSERQYIRPFACLRKTKC